MNTAVIVDLVAVPINVKHTTLLGGVLCKDGTICEDSSKGNRETVKGSGENTK